MSLALAQRQRRDFIGPRSPLTPVLLTGELKLFENTYESLLAGRRETLGNLHTGPYSNHDGNGNENVAKQKV